MPNINDLSLRVKKLWPMLKFFKRRSRAGHIQGHKMKIYGTIGKALS